MNATTIHTVESVAEIARRAMLKAAKSDSELRLCDYTDFAERLVNPQRSLF